MTTTTQLQNISAALVAGAVNSALAQITRLYAQVVVSGTVLEPLAASDMGIMLTTLDTEEQTAQSLACSPPATETPAPTPDVDPDTNPDADPDADQHGHAAHGHGLTHDHGHCIADANPADDLHRLHGDDQHDHSRCLRQ